MCVDKEPYKFLREKFKDAVFVYVSDDLKWGKEKIGQKALNRKSTAVQGLHHISSIYSILAPTCKIKIFKGTRGTT